jgi:hypothetical protein
MPIPVRSKDDTVPSAELQLGGYRSAWVFVGGARKKPQEFTLGLLVSTESPLSC